jgi:hypothetical protein
MKTRPANLVVAEATLDVLKAATEAADTAVAAYKQEVPPQHRTLQQQAHAFGLYLAYMALADARELAWERVRLELRSPRNTGSQT